MRSTLVLTLALFGALAFTPRGFGQESASCPDCGARAARPPGAWSRCFSWASRCFPRCGCPDDYCPHPFPRQCWPPYPPYYSCMPAGDGVHPPCLGVGNEKLTWWWLPTPRALRDALWCRP
jgi:hypothetical protein